MVENGCKYFSEVSYPDRIEIGVVLSQMGTSSFRLDMGMFRNGEPREAARSHFIMVTVDNASRRPMPTPEAQRQALATLMLPPA